MKKEKTNILLIERSKKIFDLLEKEKSNKFDLKLINNLYEFENILKSNFDPDIILLDLNVFSLNEIKNFKIEKNIPIVVFTGEKSEGLNALKSGAHDCLFMIGLTTQIIMDTIYRVLFRENTLNNLSRIHYSAIGAY